MKINNTSQGKYRSLSISGAILGIITVAMLLTGLSRTPPLPCDSEETTCAIFTKIDFTPNDGSYDIGRKPSGKLQYSDLEHFAVNLQLDRPAPKAFSRNFRIMEVKSNWPDAKLGYFVASFNEGSTTPTISYKRQCCGASTYPAGTPEILSDGTFWIGCTKKGKVKANGPKSGNGQARIRLEKVNKDDGFGVQGKFSPEHTIKCP